MRENRMMLINERTRAEQAIALNDILYVQLDEKTGLDRPKTWSFRCQGFLVKPDNSYILGPGDCAFKLGSDCFTTAREAREFGSKYKKDQYRLVKLSEEERIRV